LIQWIAALRPGGSHQASRLRPAGVFRQLAAPPEKTLRVLTGVNALCPESGRLELELVLETILYAIGAILIVAGLVGAVVPALPGIPLMFAGIWLIARVDQYRHLGLWWLVGIALVGAVGLTIDLVAGALGATRVGASRRAVGGALLGTVIGLFFGLPGLLLGPFFGAVLGELAAGNSVLRSTHVGVGTWIGLIFGTLIKMVASLTMVALFAAGWWWNRP
jgi:uncharacterized protein YqgC (DUF456 family)